VGGCRGEAPARGIFLLITMKNIANVGKATMPVRIITIPFEPHKEIFQDEDLMKFLLTKHVKDLHPEFFQMNGRAYWTVFVNYENVLSDNDANKKQDGLNEGQKLLFTRLREWRKETAEKDGVPVYIIATNKQLMDIIHGTPRTLEMLRQIQGFGKKKVEKHGKEIIGIIDAFTTKRSLDTKIVKKSDERDAS
jgi:superfamily II DNA helicase RecQ